MPNEEAIAFHYAVYEEVKKVPHGKVTTYGHIAKLIDRPQNPRQVGQSLKLLTKNSQASEFNTETVPWWRVLNAQGKISLRAYGMERQLERLQIEGVTVIDHKIDFEECGWFPRTEYDESDEDSEEDSDEELHNEDGNLFNTA